MRSIYRDRIGKAQESKLPRTDNPFHLDDNCQHCLGVLQSNKGRLELLHEVDLPFLRGDRSHNSCNNNL